MSSNKGYRGLGRGLETLLNSPRADDPHLSPLSQASNSNTQLPVTLLHSGRFQPRRQFDESQLEALAQSIKTQGMVQPIVVRQQQDEKGLNTNQYEIIAGERRWRAAQKAGLDNVPVVIRNDIDDQQSMAIALIENIQREDLNAIEEAEGLKRLNQEFGLTHEEVARLVGRSRSAITNSLRLLELNPDVQTMVREDKLKMGHARALLSLDSQAQFDLAKQAYKKQMTAREVEKLVHQNTQQGEDRNTSLQVSDEQKVVLRTLQHQLTQLLNKPVRVNYKANGQGNISINFIDIGEVKDLIEKLKN